MVARTSEGEHKVRRYKVPRMMSASPPILLVEDDLSLRESLCAFLEDHGYRTQTAATTREGWEALRRGSVRLCLLDLNLPDGSGVDLLQRVAKAGLETRVVVMTAFDLAHLRPAGVGTTLAAWMTKPVNPNELLKVVEAALVGADESKNN